MKQIAKYLLIVIALLLAQYVLSSSALFYENRVNRVTETIDSLTRSYDSAFVDSTVIRKWNHKKVKHKRKKIAWVDSVYQSLTPDERIGQLFMVAAYSNKDEKHKEEITKLICDYHIGGLMCMQGGPYRAAALTNYYQAITKTPLLISIDAEWGLAMRLDSVTKFPKQMTLGAIQNDSLVFAMGAQLANECKRLGIQLNFAPVVDINSNPSNPVIGFRSFGENKYNVTRKGVAYMKGLQSQHVMSNAKHFPGHGDTDTDSHKTLPVINHSRERMDTLELYPFKALIKEGLTSIMVGHLHIPAYDTTKNSASTLSRNVVTNLLKDTLKFKGLVFTDALNMKGVSDFFKPGMVDAKALLAGNDMLLFAEDVPTAIIEIKKAIDSCEISWKEINERCYKILKAKEWVGLNHLKPIDTRNLYDDLNSVKSQVLNKKLYEAAMTLLTNNNNLIPLKRLDTLHIASLSIGDKQVNTFQRTLDNYTTVAHFNLSNDDSKTTRDSVLQQLSNYNLVLICTNNTNVKPQKNFGISDRTIQFIDSVKTHSKVILTVLANPNSLTKFQNPLNYDALIMGYEEAEYSEQLCAELIFGGATSKGKLAVSVPPFFALGTGIDVGEPVRFKYVLPEEINIASKKLTKIDSIVSNAITNHATPGCQILVAKDGKVFYQKSFGYHTYENRQKVINTDIYDLASVTKVSASLPMLMQLYDEGKIKLDSTLGTYLPEVRNSNKENLVLRDILTHQARLKAWIPFYKNTLEKGDWKTSIYSKTPQGNFTTKVADSLYILNSYRDSIYSTITASALEPKKQYLYSDLGYYYMKSIIEKLTHDSLQNDVQKIYTHLGMSTTGYLPLLRFEKQRIVPTEYDVTFRKQLVQGYVHDPGAAMLGGVGGHAGLFSDANDLAKLMQMYLNNGTYGGERYIETQTMQSFTDCQFCDDGNRRAIGFDKPEPNPKKDSPCASCVSLLSFGHTGFTGTMVWMDPVSKLVYVFLSNRVYPDAENKKLVQLSVRTKIQEAIYDAIK